MQRGRGRRQPRAIDQDGLYGAPIIGGDVNLTDMGQNDPDWYDRPEWERTEIMRQAKVRLDKERANEEKRRAQEEAERLSGMHAPKPKPAEEDSNASPETPRGQGYTHYAKLGLYPFQQQPAQRAIDRDESSYAEDA
jgi:hypothetical protein